MSAPPNDAAALMESAEELADDVAAFTARASIQYGRGANPLEALQAARDRAEKLVATLVEAQEAVAANLALRALAVGQG